MALQDRPRAQTPIVSPGAIICARWSGLSSLSKMFSFIAIFVASLMTIVQLTLQAIESPYWSSSMHSLTNHANASPNSTETTLAKIDNIPPNAPLNPLRSSKMPSRLKKHLDHEKIWPILSTFQSTAKAKAKAR